MTTLIEKIIIGQANIDQMKAEIKMVTGMLLGWLRRNLTAEESPMVIIPCGPAIHGRQYEWRFFISDPCAAGFWVAWGNTLVLHYSEQWSGVRLDEISTIHATLGTLVQEMLKRFPELGPDVITPLCAAAGVAEESA